MKRGAPLCGHGNHGSLLAVALLEQGESLLHLQYRAGYSLTQVPCVLTTLRECADHDDASYSTQLKKSSFSSWYDDYTNGASLEDDLALPADNQLKLAYSLERGCASRKEFGERA